MEKAYLICDYSDDKASSIPGCPNVGIEYLGNCGGRIIRENGELIGEHHSSTFRFLRADLIGKLDDSNNYEIIDLIGKEVPERFKKLDQKK